MKQGRPVLYELLNDQPRYRNRRDAGGDSLDDGSMPGHSGIGRVLRVPVGYLFVVVAVVIVIGALAYMYGFMRGQDEVEPSILDEYMASQEGERIGASLTEPGGASPGGGGAPGGVVPGEDQSKAAGTSAAGAQADERRERSDWGAILSDPRVSGKSYFRLVQTIQRNAMEVAEFCRAQGLEAYVVPVNNSDLFYVYVFPGFTKAEEGSAQVRQLRALIEEVRIRWRAKTGRDDLSGYISVLKR